MSAKFSITTRIFSKAALALVTCFLTFQTTSAKADNFDGLRDALGIHREVNQRGVIVNDKPNGWSELWNGNKEYHALVTYKVNIEGTTIESTVWITANNTVLVRGRMLKIVNVELKAAGY